MQKNSASLLVLFLALLLGLQPITSDLYLPTLPSLGAALQTQMPQIQLTLSAMLLGFGLSQLAWGPVSDRLGRRPILLMGLALYSLAAFASAGVGSIEALIVWRGLEGIAMGAAVMCARAMARDVYEPKEAAALVSKGLSGLGVIAMLAVPVGSMSLEYLGWRWTLALPGFFSVLVLILIFFKFEETNSLKNPRALEPQILLSTWRMILQNKQFWTYALLALTSYAGLFVFLATSSFVFLQLMGKSKLFYSLVIAGMSGTYIVGTFLARRVLAKQGVQRMVWVGGWITLLALILFLGFYALGIRSAWALVLPHYVFMLGHGFHQPAGQAGSSAPFPQAAGASSAMAGFLMMSAAFLVGTWLGAVMSANNSVFVMVAGMSFWSAATCLVAWTWVQRYGKLG